MAHEALWEALTGALEDRHETEAMVAAAAAAPPHALSPWALWMLISLARHVHWQQRVGTMLRDELGVDLGVVARSGRVALPEGVARRGQLGFGTYRFHERGVRYKNDGTYEIVDIDLVAGDADHIDLQLLADGLHGNGALRDGDVRLWQLHPSFQTFEYAWDELVELGLLAPRAGVSRLARLAAEVDPHRSTLMRVGREFDSASNDHPYPRTRLIMAAKLGDWLEADRIARLRVKDAGWAQVFTGPRAAEQEARRRERLLALNPADREGTVIVALVELDAMAAAPHVREVLAGPHDRRCVTAMRTIRFRTDRSFQPNPDYSDDVLALFRRIDLRGSDFEYALWPLCAGFLLDRGLHADEVVATFSSLGDTLAPHAAILAFSHAPGLVVPLLRQALRALLPIARADAVAILAQLDEPWCAPMMAEALETSDDPELTLEWRTGLRMMKDPAGAARAWEAASPLMEDDDGCLVRCEEWIRGRMRDLRQDMNPVLALREKRRAPA